MTQYPFTLFGTAETEDAAQILELVAEHFIEHGTVTRLPRGCRIESTIGSADFTETGDRLEVAIACPSEALLETVRGVLAEHLFMFAGDRPLRISWADGGRAGTPPDFGEATVVKSVNVTPRMRRVTLSTENVSRFVGGDLHVRLMIPPAGRAPVWPKLMEDGRTSWPQGEDRLVVRAYTIRRCDQARGEIEIDFVLHEGDETPAASWAAAARPGERIGIQGPGGGTIPQAERLLLAGDETALPAILRIAEALPRSAKGRIFVEVEDAAEEQAIVSAADLEVTWLHRQGKPAGDAGLLQAAIRETFPTADPDLYVWAACEHAEASAIRKFVKNERGHGRDMHLVAAYWRRGEAG